MISETLVRSTLATVRYPGFTRDIVSFGLVKAVVVTGADVTVELQLSTRDANVPRQIHAETMSALEALPGIGQIKLNFDIKEPAQPAGAAAATGKSSIPGVKKVIVVASGKGGVGKSTVAANLAVALSQTGARVGLCDCDLYGPSIAHMFGTRERPLATEKEEIVPVRQHGLQLMSMGLLLDDASPVIVRGPIATRYTQQFLRQCAWEDLDYLVLDLPPGTGDIQLTIVQSVSVDGAVIVTTPQEVALIDARKAVSMFQKVNVPILGIVENMSYFLCPSDGVSYPIFGSGGGQREADRLGVPLLAQVPIEMAVREQGDAGLPLTLKDPAAKSSTIFRSLAQSVLKAMS
jgi:ATP-binding protein involved in chromosome partitioning